MEAYRVFGAVIPQFVRAMLIVLIYVLTALVLRRLLFRTIKRAAGKSATRWDDVAIAALRGPVVLFIVVSTAWVAGRFAGLPLAERHVQVLDQAIRVGVILGAILFVDQF